MPTQVVTEFVRSRVRWRRESVDGIKYMSSVLPERACYVLFATQEHIVVDAPKDQPEEQPWLELIDVKHCQVSLAVSL